MKWITLAMLTAIGAPVVQAQTLFTYGKYPVTQKEFVAAFDKNPSAANRKKAMEEYLPLYINYKLKVQDAYDKKMDTLPNQLEDLANYRVQLEESFLAQLSQTDALVKEAFERSQKDILLGHLYIGFKPGDTAAERSAAGKAQQAQQQLKAGMSFADAVNKFGTDADARARQGKVGWVTVFTLPYNYESAIYKTPVGKTTDAIKGSDGYHIFMNMQERPAVGRVNVAQIMLWLSPNATAADDAQKKKLADSLYQALKRGASFDTLAMDFSNDRSSYASGGILQEFGVAAYDSEFETQAFALNKPGDLSQPFRTPYGWHILKLISKKPVSKDINDAEAMQQIKLQVMNDNRAVQAKENFIRQRMKSMVFQQAKFSYADLWRFTDSARRNASTDGMPVQKTTLLFSFGKEKIEAENWSLYARAVRGSAKMSAEEYQQMWDKYVLQTAEAHYRKNLNVYEPAFNAQLKEFRDANLLFENMDKEVWTAAAEDTAGLRKHYLANRASYKWGEGAYGIVASSLDSAVIEKYRAELLASPANWKHVNEKYKDQIVADSSRMERNQVPGNPTGELKPGMVTPLIHNALDNSYSFAYLFAPAAGGDQRSLDDARGWVISDYQQVLEKQWVERLRKKYLVKVNEAVWKQLLANTK